MARGGVTVETRAIEYEHEGSLFEGVLAFEHGANARRPAVLVIHGWEGRSDAQVAFARKLAELGYVGLACDLYGKGISPSNPEECRRLMTPLMQDRGLLQRRLLHAMDVMGGLPEADAHRVAAIGFCFGGLCALDIARTGADVRAVASFHGLFTPPGNTTGKKIKAKVIAFHGWDDPFAPPEDVVALGPILFT